MPPDKPLKLLPEGVRTFLEIGLKHAVDEQKAAVNDEQKKSSMFKFVKMICVSNSYLHCSRRIDLDIYRFNLGFSQFVVGILRISFTSKRYDSSSGVYLTYDYAYKLMKFLLPSYNGVSFHSGFEAAHELEQQFEILEFAKGKIGLDLRKCCDVKFAHKLLKLFADRTHGLYCSSKFLMFDKKLQLPTLDYLFVDSLENFDQAFQLLQHKVKELEFDLITQDFAIEDENLAYAKNETVKNLKLLLPVLSHIKLKKLVEYFCKSCLNLKHLDLKVRRVHIYEFPANQVPNQVNDYVGRLSALKTCFKDYLINTFIKFAILIHVEDQGNSTWVKTVCENPELNNWQTTSSKGAFGVEKLEMTFDGAGRKFELFITVAASAAGKFLVIRDWRKE